MIACTSHKINGPFATNFDSAENGTCLSQKAEPVNHSEIPTRKGMSDISTNGTLVPNSVKTNSLLITSNTGNETSNDPRDCKTLSSMETKHPNKWPIEHEVHCWFSLVERYPQGFPRLAAFQDSSSDLAIFRRFGTAHCRLLMHLQCEITSIIKELDELDISDSEGGMLYRLRRNEWYEGLDRTQKDLLEKLQGKILIYGKISLLQIAC